MTDELLPPPEEGDTTGFDVAFRGYDRRQVEDYVERVEIALTDADRQHQADNERLGLLEREITALQVRLADAERKAAGMPDPSSRTGERLVAMLQLAEQEAEEIVQLAHDRAAANTADLQASLERREVDAAAIAAAAEQARLDAQRDAEMVRSKSQQDADAKRATAQQDAEAVWAKAQQEAEALWAKAQHDADELLAGANREARALDTDARRHADSLVAGAHQEAEQLRADAAERAQALVQRAERDAASIDAEARDHNARLLADGRHQVEELQIQRDTITAQIQALRESVRPTTDPD